MIIIILINIANYLFYHKGEKKKRKRKESPVILPAITYKLTVKEWKQTCIITGFSF